MNKFLIILVTAALLFFSGFGIFSYKQSQQEQIIMSDNLLTTSTESAQIQNSDFEASFAIFTNGTFRIFTAPMYHNLSPDVYITASFPNTVYVKKTGITWNDFFSTLPFSLTTECLTTGTKETFCTGKNGTLRFYLNGEESNDALGREIQSGDKLLVTFGNESESKIQKQLIRVP